MQMHKNQEETKNVEKFIYALMILFSVFIFWLKEASVYNYFHITSKCNLSAIISFTKTICMILKW